MRAILDAGNIGGRVFDTKQRSGFTLPPLPLGFDGNLDLVPFLLYDGIIIDANSVDYLSQDGLLNEPSQRLLHGLIDDRIVEVKDYESLLRPLRNVVEEQAQHDYDFAKREAKERLEKSMYFRSKSEWREVIRAIETFPESVRSLPDTVDSVQNNLSRIIKGKLIPRDYRFLRDNLLDVNCVHHLSRELGVPVHCWPDWAVYHDRKVDVACQAESEKQKLSGKVLRRIWQVAFPKLSLEHVDPDKVREILASDGVKEIRHFVETSRLRPEEIDDAWHEQIQQRAALVDSRSEVMAYGSLIVASVCGFALSPLGGVALGVGLFASERIYRKIEKHRNRMAFAISDLHRELGE